jgi:hypothetical protein
LLAEYELYRGAWATLPADHKELTMTQFWSKYQGRWPYLAQVGKWHAETPTSSVDAERAFGQMRTMEAGNRMSMEAEAFEAEAFFRFNSWVVDEMLAGDLHAAKKTKLKLTY